MEAGGERLIRVPTSLSSLLATAKMWKRYRRMAILSENSQNTPHKTPINFHSTCGYVHECQSSEWTETSCHALTTIKSNSASTMISEWFRLVYLSRCFWLIFDRQAFWILLMKQAKAEMGLSLVKTAGSSSLWTQTILAIFSSNFQRGMENGRELSQWTHV